MAVMDTGAGMTGGIAAIVAAVAAAPGARRQQDDRAEQPGKHDLSAAASKNFARQVAGVTDQLDHTQRQHPLDC